VVTVGIADYNYNELLTMARDTSNVVTVESFSRMNTITEQILERSCETEIEQKAPTESNNKCKGNVVADGLNHYFMCDTGFCDWKFNLKSDKCVKVYGSRFDVKPNDTNKEWFKQGKKIEFSYGYENCDQKKPFHVSIMPCEEEGDYELNYEFHEIPCGIGNFTFDIDFT
jgi:hypothetical protein